MRWKRSLPSSTVPPSSVWPGVLSLNILRHCLKMWMNDLTDAYYHSHPLSPRGPSRQWCQRSPLIPGNLTSQHSLCFVCFCRRTVLPLNSETGLDWQVSPGFQWSFSFSPSSETDWDIFFTVRLLFFAFYVMFKLTSQFPYIAIVHGWRHGLNTECVTEKYQSMGCLTIMKWFSHIFSI